MRRAFIKPSFASFVGFISGLASNAFAADGQSQDELVQSLLRITSLGSKWVLWLLLGLSVVSLGVILERAVFFFLERRKSRQFREGLLDLLQQADWEGALAACKHKPSFEAKVAGVAIEYRLASSHVVEQIVGSFVGTERSELDRGLTFLGTLGNNAPFIGLFGTVLGIIDAFHALALNPAGGAAVVMAGISEALVATAVGLAVAIPAVIAFNTFQRLVKLKIEGAMAMQGMVIGHAAKAKSA